MLCNPRYISTHAERGMDNTGAQSGPLQAYVQTRKLLVLEISKGKTSSVCCCSWPISGKGWGGGVFLAPKLVNVLRQYFSLKLLQVYLTYLPSDVFQVI